MVLQWKHFLAFSGHMMYTESHDTVRYKSTEEDANITYYEESCKRHSNKCVERCDGDITHAKYKNT